MKKFVIAAGLIVAGVTSAAAQWAPPPPPGYGEWRRGNHPYEARHHASCQEKAWRLHSYHRRAKSDGVLTWRERRIVQSLERDLDRTCGRFRWRG